MKVTLEKVIRREKEGKKGPYTQVSVKIKDQWVTAFGGKWNESWSDGDVVEIEKEQFTQNEYNGKIYHNIKAPAGASRQWNNSASEVTKKLDTIIDMLTQLLASQSHSNEQAPDVDPIEAGAGFADPTGQEDVPF